MLYLHKLLPSLFLPIGLTIVLVGLGLLLKKRSLCWVGLGLLYLLSTGFVSGKIMALVEGTGGPASLQTRLSGGATATQVSRREMERVQEAEAIVVLSGMLRDRRDAPLGEWSEAVDRFEGGLDLFKGRKAPILIFTGGYVPWLPDARPEGEVLKERAVNLGVPENKIQVTGKVGNTEAEASAVKELLENLKMREVEGGKRDNKQLTANSQQPTNPVGSGQLAVGGKKHWLWRWLGLVKTEEKAGRSGPRIILVTSAFHMPRAKMLFERQGFEVEPFPVDFRVSDRQRINILSFLPKAEYLEDSEIAIREGMGILYYSVIKR